MDELGQSAEGGGLAIVELLRLAAPTVAQMVSYTIMQFIDTWILSRLGGMQATAVANSGMMAFSVLSFGMGVTFIVNTLVSQSYGRKDYASCGRYLWQGVWFGVIYGVMLLPMMGAANWMFRAFGHGAEMAGMEGTYYRIVLMAASVKLVSTALGQFMLGINRPNAVLVAAVFGVTINAVAAWMIVLGHAGFRSMGVAGAAWAQNIGVSCELIMLVVLALPGAVRARYGVGDARIRAREMWTLVKVGVPSGLQWFNDILAWSIFCNFVMAVVGAAAMEANTFMLRYMVVSFMPAIGISSAVTALVGRYIGRGKPQVGARYANLAFGVTITYMIACGCVFYLGRTRLIRVFSDDPEVLRIGAMFMTFAAIYQAFDAMYIIYNGAPRGAGDTLVPATVTAFLCWGITVGGGYFAARHAGIFGNGGPWMMATVYGMVVGVFMLVRFRRGGWAGIVLARGV